MIKTGYFAKINTYINAGYTPISIAQFPPRYVKCARWKEIAPSKELLMSSKKHLINHDEYIKVYLNQLNKSKESILESLNDLSDGDYVLLCYEKPNDFCHRHLFAEWVKVNFNIEICEFKI